MIQILQYLAGIATALAVVTLMLWFNGWGATVPSELAQLIWAFNIVVWPPLVYYGVGRFR